MDNSITNFALHTLQLRILGEFATAAQPIAKYNFLGRPYQPGSFELALNTGFSVHERQAARRALENLVAEGFLQPTMSMLVAEVSGLEDEAGIFAAGFWRDFYRALLTNAMRNAITKLLLVVVAASLIPLARADADGCHLELVIALDLTKSVDVVGPDGEAEFQKNIDGVTGVLAEVPVGARVTIIGITDQSFAQPHILMSASVSPDAGYFGERISAARAVLINAWKSRASTLRPDAPETDVFGAALLAGQILAQAPAGSRRTLVFFSDMRNSTSGYNLERDPISGRPRNQAQAQPDLRNVDVYVFGVDDAGKSIAYWQTLQGFWVRYFSSASALLRSYSALRAVPAF